MSIEPDRSPLRPRCVPAASPLRPRCVPAASPPFGLRSPRTSGAGFHKRSANLEIRSLESCKTATSA
eukprot:5720161-Alexandrium_andersonii.AAC.1